MNLEIGDTRFIINECKKRDVLRNQCAYLLATTALETAYTMKPITEYGGPKYFHKMYDINGNRPKKARELGNIYPGDGAKFPGHGYVMATGRTNHQKLTDKTGINCIDHPENATLPEVAVVGLIDGCLEGWWTGRKLTQYITLHKSDFYNARRVVNGLDRAGDIARLAKEYDTALLREGYGVEDVKDIPVPQAKPKTTKNLATSQSRSGKRTPAPIRM